MRLIRIPRALALIPLLLPFVASANGPHDGAYSVFESWKVTVNGKASTNHATGIIQVTNGGFVYLNKTGYSADFGTGSIADDGSVTNSGHLAYYRLGTLALIRLNFTAIAINIGSGPITSIETNWYASTGNIQTAISGSGETAIHLGTNVLIFDATSTAFLTNILIAPKITGQPASRTELVGTNASISVGFLGSPPLTFRWKHAGTNISEGGEYSVSNDGTLTINPVQARDTGSYSVMITNALGKVASASALLSVYAPITLLVNGGGYIAPNYNGGYLLVGRSYTVNAWPNPGNLLSNWVDDAGNVLTTSRVLKLFIETNFFAQANFITNPFIEPAGNYAGFFYVTNTETGVTLTNAGFFSATVNKPGGGFSAKLQMGPRTIPFSGQFSLAGGWAASALNSARWLGASLQLDLDGNDTITGLVTSSNWTATLLAVRNAGTNGAATKGNYTFFLPGSADSADFPGGNGFASLSLTKAGTVTISGKLGDGTPFTPSTFASKDGDVPLYASPYGNKGLVLGWLTFTNDAATTNDLEGLVNWIKPTAIMSTKLYTNGFTFGVTNGIEAFGSYWTNSRPLLAWSNGVVSLSGGNLGQELDNDIGVSTNGFVSDQTHSNKLTMTITPTTGLFTGGATLTNGVKRLITYGGAFHQKRGAGYGQFNGTNQSGGLIIQAQ